MKCAARSVVGDDTFGAAVILVAAISLFAFQVASRHMLPACSLCLVICHRDQLQICTTRFSSSSLFSRPYRAHRISFLRDPPIAFISRCLSRNTAFTSIMLAKKFVAYRFCMIFSNSAINYYEIKLVAKSTIDAC